MTTDSDVGVAELNMSYTIHLEHSHEGLDCEMDRNY